MMAASDIRLFGILISSPGRGSKDYSEKVALSLAFRLWSARYEI